ncbi:MAG TPA: SirB2 family protein [Gammaproteobacteria bacterium]|nr:SirB2 family protein [Gammaproteobacteria bacterium]
MFYSVLKSIHIGCVVLSISGFILRGIWMMNASALLQHSLTRRLPHIIDTLLLASALIMAYLSSQYPMQQPWLTAKLFALLVYIGLGMVALRFGKTAKIRVLAWLLAVLVFFYIVLVAISRNPVPFFS